MAATNSTSKPTVDEGPKVTEQSPDVQAASKSKDIDGEGELRALRQDAGLNQLPGHGAHILSWEASEQGKEFLKGEKDRNKEAEEGAKKAHDGLDKDNDLSEPEKKYREALGIK